jgi:hypothetical protein
MKKRILYIIALLMPVVWLSCKEEGRIDFIDDSAAVPAQVTDVNVENRPGGALLTYTLPEDKNLLYVRAEYEIQPGVVRTVKSSYLKDSLELSGFGTPAIYDVKLFSVGKNEKESAPKIVQISPLTAPVHSAVKKMRDTFGGVGIDFENPTKANLAIVLMADTANLGYEVELITYYTSLPKGTFTYRGVAGLEPVPQNFSLYFRDRWGNLSDTLSQTVTPWFEEFVTNNNDINGNKNWVTLNDPSDLPPVNSGYSLPRIWDGTYTGDGFHGQESGDPAKLPVNLTWDLGKTWKLSRLKLYPRQNADDRWKRGHPRKFQIWGANAPLTGPSMDGWIPLGEFESLKPSGPGTQITDEDIAFANAGIDFDFVISDFAPDPTIPVRYIRFRTIWTYANMAYSTVSICEISFWGEKIN